MPVDPNEPTYCVCQQVSYGEMIGCDNTEVSIPSRCSNSLVDCHTLKLICTLISIAVPNRMVPLRMRWTHNKTERQMVLPEMFTGS